ncbi:MAG TPA: fatty acid desaturase family protein [Nevskiaceae bacterium]|nr:fatty acid desaturase family protein [Nevskiaceae bacterium]
MKDETITTSTPVDVPVVTRRALQAALTREEIAALTARSDWRGALAIARSWLIIAGAFALAAAWPNPLTIVVAMILIAGRQLALAVLEHEGAHGTLFKTRWMNDVLCDWLCARPVWQNLKKYRAHHLVHHTHTGSDQDPDLSLHAGYPVSRASMRRKLLRDVSGYTGVKLIIGLVLMDAGYFKWTVSNHVEKLPQDGRRWWNYGLDFLRNASGMLAANLALYAVLAASGHGWLYLLWVGAYLTPFPLLVRVRSIAEHGVLPRVPDMLRNTRTTRATPIERLLWAPLQVNYHVEHHAMASVPYYRLPQLHALLRARGVLGPAPDYFDVLRLASTPAAAH